MDLARSTSRLELLTPASLGYRLRSLWILVTRSGRLAAWCEVAGGWVLVGAIAGSPWLTAGLDPWSIRVIAAWLSCGVGLWAASRWYGRPTGRLDLSTSWRVLAAIVASIGLLGTASVLHATNGFHPIDHVLVQPLAPSRWLPSTVYRRGTADWLVQVGPVLASIVAMADLARSSAWLRRFLAALAVSGAIVAVYGCLRHAHLLPALVAREESDRDFPQTAFAAFRKHGNAGAWLNLALPAAIGMALLSAGRARVAWAVAAGLITTGALVNISKIASVLAIVIVGAAGLAVLAQGGVRDWRGAGRRTLMFVVVPVLLLLALATVTGRFSAWGELRRVIENKSGRQIMWSISRRIAADGGAFGYGAGSFKVLLPTSPHFDPEIYLKWAVTKYMPGTAISQWMYPCNDLLQSWIEWGPVGTALGLLIPAGAAVGLVAARRRRDDPMRRVVAGVSLLALAVVAFHSMGDYPLQVLSIQIATGAYLAIGWSLLSKPRVAKVFETTGAVT